MYTEYWSWDVETTFATKARHVFFELTALSQVKNYTRKGFLMVCVPPSSNAIQIHSIDD